MTDSEPEPGPGYHPASITLPFLTTTALAALTPAALFILLFACLLAAFVFALFENSLLHFSRVRLMAEAKRLDREAAIDAVLLQEDDLLFASKMGRGLAQMFAVALLATALVSAQPNAWTVVGWVIGGALFFLAALVTVPHVIATRWGDTILLRGIVAFSRAIAPVRPVAGLLQRLVARAMRAGNPPDPVDEIKDDILSAVEEGSREGTVDESEKMMIEGVIDLRAVVADQIMTPRTEMVCLPVDATLAEAIERSQERGHSRLPVFRDTPDDILGVLYVKDLLPYLGKPTTPRLASVLRRPFFIPQSKNVRELLQEMKTRQVHLAVVLDEYGGTAGVVTIEDILEEIVGEITDEHEAAAARDVVKINDSAATVEGRTHVDDLNRALDLQMPESEEYETVGGLLFNHMGRVPSAGEHYDLNGVRFTVLEADERRINRVKVTVQRS